MPAVILNIKINSIGSSGVVNIGDSFYLSPKSTSKTFAGSGSFGTGDFQKSINGISSTNTLDGNVIDTNILST